MLVPLLEQHLLEQDVVDSNLAFLTSDVGRQVDNSACLNARLSFTEHTKIEVGVGVMGLKHMMPSGDGKNVKSTCPHAGLNCGPSAY